MRKPRARMCSREAMPVQVAAVCYRRQEGSPRFLLVRTSSGRWTFPKGRLEKGLSYHEVAALEAFEEGGVQGRVDPCPIGRYLHRKESLRGLGSTDVTVIAFLLEVKTSDLPSESHRTPSWFSSAEAKLRLADRRTEKYRRGIERIFDCALRQIGRRHSCQ
jgi:8-oxo-dGTP pyrophosphatase MutT (NUDIX family)